MNTCLYPAWVHGVCGQARWTDPFAVVYRHERRDDALRMILRLPPRQSAVLMLVFFHGYTVAEAARLIGITKIACHAVVHRALLGVRQALHRQHLHNNVREAEHE